MTFKSAFLVWAYIESIPFVDASLTSTAIWLTQPHFSSIFVDPNASAEIVTVPLPGTGIPLPVLLCWHYIVLRVRTRSVRGEQGPRRPTVSE